MKGVILWLTETPYCINLKVAISQFLSLNFLYLMFRAVADKELMYIKFCSK